VHGSAIVYDNTKFRGRKPTGVDFMFAGMITVSIYKLSWARGALQNSAWSQWQSFWNLAAPETQIL